MLLLVFTNVWWWLCNRYLESPSDMTTATIINRILANKKAYEDRNAKKVASEQKYYKNKQRIQEGWFVVFCSFEGACTDMCHGLKFWNRRVVLAALKVLFDLIESAAWYAEFASNTKPCDPCMNQCSTTGTAPMHHLLCTSKEITLCHLKWSLSNYITCNWSAPRKLVEIHTRGTVLQLL